MAKDSTTERSEKLKDSEPKYSPEDLDSLADWIAEVLAEQRISEVLKDERNN